MVKNVFAVTALMAGLMVNGSASGQSASPKDVLNKIFPDIKVGEVRQTAVEGLYEIEARGNIFYFAPKAEMLFVGEMINKEKKNLTDERRAEIAAARMKEIPLDKAVKIGSGKNTVIEFTDPDCPHCRKASDFFKTRTDVTRHIFFFPLTQIHPDAEAKSEYILCAKDRAKAYEEVMSGKLDGKKPKECPEGKGAAMLKEHTDIAGKVGVQGTPNFFINGKNVSGANIPLIEKLLKSGE